MPPERLPLIASLILQGFVAVTYAVAFFGLWRGFGRGAARRLAIAWAVLGLGLWWVVSALYFGVTAGWPGPLRGLEGLPLLLGTLLLRPAVDALLAAEARESPPAPGRYVPVFLGAGLAATASYPVVVLAFPDAAGPIFGYVIPRLLLAGAMFWTALPILRLPRERWQAGYTVISVSLGLMVLRTGGAAAREIYHLFVGMAQSPESNVLTFVQVSLTILLGLGFAVALTDSEGRKAMRSAQTIRDTAEALRDSERRFRFMVERSSDLLTVVSPGGLLRYVSPTAERILGTPGAALESTRLHEHVHPHDRGALARLLEGPGTSTPGDVAHLRLRSASGEWRDFEVSHSVGEEGEGEGMVLSLRDVTDRKRLEAQVLDAQRLDSLGFMAGSMAHDFNNTLLAVQAGAELLAEDLDEQAPELSEQAKDIMDAAERGGALVRQLLDFSRRRRAKPQVFDVGERVRELESLLTRAVGLGVSLDITVLPGATPVQADPDQLDQVLLNLAVNAKHAMPDGGVLLVTVAPDTEGTSPYVRIEVRDDGPGIPEDMLDQIFEPFFTTRSDAGGSGLGLATARGFAQRSGGTLSVESSVGVGTRFTMRLPLDRSLVGSQPV